MTHTFRHYAIWFNGLPADQSPERIIARLRAARIDHPFVAADHAKDGEKVQGVIDEAHRHGLTIHGDFDALRNRGDAPADLGQILKDGTLKPVLCPANPAVVDLVLEKLARMVASFDYDGITLDDGYYFSRAGLYDPDGAPGSKFRRMPSCYCAYCQRHAPLETPEWEEWKRDAISALIEKQAALVRQLKPGTRFSAAAHMPYQRAFYDAHQQDIPYFEGWGISESYYGYLNDWPAWVRRGHLDFVLPMIYYHSRQLVQWQTEECRSLLPDASRNVWVGLGLGGVTAEFYQGLGDVNPVGAGDPAMRNDAVMIEAQLQDQLRMGQEHVAFFCYSELADEHLPVLARYRGEH